MMCLDGGKKLKNYTLQPWRVGFQHSLVNILPGHPWSNPFVNHQVQWVCLRRGTTKLCRMPAFQWSYISGFASRSSQWLCEVFV